MKSLNIIIIKEEKCDKQNFEDRINFQNIEMKKQHKCRKEKCNF
jgi:hypothetical protein